MTQNTSHLSKLGGNVRLVAWHNDRDIQAVKFNDISQEKLYIDGQLIKLDPRKHHHAVQQVINLCRMDDEDLIKYSEKLKAL
jgi:hypothetical protein